MEFTAKERITFGQENKEITDQHLSRYVFAKEFAKGKVVLDIACGTGYGSEILRKGGAERVVGVDISTDTIEYARVNYASPGLEFSVGSAEHLGSGDQFDLIVSFETIEHLASPEKFLFECTKTLVDDGVFIVSTPVRLHGTIHDKPSNRYHVQEWSVDEFKNLLGNYFMSISSYGQYNLRKNWFPFSRTLKRSLFRLLTRKHFEAYDKWPVVAVPPRFSHFDFEMVYIVCVCRKS